MHLTITAKERQNKTIEVIGLHVLQLAQVEEERFLATLQAYLQQLERQGFRNFTKVEILTRFGSGKSGACVFPIVLFTPGADPKRNHSRVLKYDDASRVEQELSRYNSLVSQGQATYEQLDAVASTQFPEKSLLSLRNLGEQVIRMDELLTRVLHLLTQPDDADARCAIHKALQDVLGRLYERHYSDSDHQLAKLPRFNNRAVREIFAPLFPAELVIDADVPGSFAAEGMLVGLDAVHGEQYRFRKKYLLLRDPISPIDLMTGKEVDA